MRSCSGISATSEPMLGVTGAPLAVGAMPIRALERDRGQTAAER